MVIQELKNKFRQNNIHNGATICIFSDITSFGIPSSLKTHVRKRGARFLLDSYIDTFKTVVGKAGLIVMPTFTYSATKKEIFDVDNTPSTVGTLTEYFRKQNGVKRSTHPVFSFAAWGKTVSSFLKLDNFDCFGKGSIFDKLYNLNANYVLFGVDIQHGASFIYYSEEKLRVYYRYFKNFPAVIKDGKKTLKTTVRYFVRDLDLKYEDYWFNLERQALKTGIAKSIKFSGANILLMKSQEIEKLIQQEVSSNQDYLIKKK